MLKNVLAFAAVRNIQDGIRWYKMLIGRDPDTQPMPVCTMGYSTPKSSQARVCRAAGVEALTA